MSKRQELIEKYADALRKIGMDVDTDLLTAVTIACGPSIYNSDSSSVSPPPPASCRPFRTISA